MVCMWGRAIWKLLMCGKHWVRTRSSVLRQRRSEQALKAQAHGADYLGVGAVFGTTSKADATKLDHKVLKEICETVDIPVVAIGGITGENVTELAGNGICGVAVISAVFGQPDIEQATKELKEKVEGMLK